MAVFFNLYWWQNKLKYWPLFQKLFLFFSLSNQFPANLNIEAANDCNFRCSFCPRRLSGRRLGLMSFALYKKIIDEISREKRLQVLWLMKDGESLIHPEIDQMIGYAKKKRVARRIEIYTNGFFLDQKMGRKLINSGLDVLTVSLDALNKEDFRRLKGVDAYERVIGNIERFCRLKKKLRVKRPLLAVKMIDEGSEKRRGEFERRWKGIADSVIIQKLHNWEGSIENIKNQKSKIKDQRSKIGRYPCNLPWLNSAVFWDGKVTACCVNFKENELVMGDLKRQSLKDIFQGKKFKSLRRAHLNQDFSRFPTCARCQYWRELAEMSFRLRRIDV